MPAPRLTTADIPGRRLRSSGLAGVPQGRAEDVVRRLCAVQSQDYAGAKWAIGQRATGTTDADIDALLDAGTILRTHVLRPTWHFVLPGDIRWMLRLSRSRVKAALAFYDRSLGVDATEIARSNDLLARELEGGVALTRAELAMMYRRNGVSAENQRVGHLLMHAELDALICSGGLRGRQLTYALLDERAPSTTPAVSGDQALAELAARYFASHGPAQLRDLVWWSGLTTRQARLAIELATATLRSATVDGATYWFAATPTSPRRGRPLVHLLPNWDEYLVGYADRSLLVDSAAFTAAPPKGDLLANSVVIDGRVVGFWRRTVSGGDVTVTAKLRVALTDAERTALERTCDLYSRFVGRPVRLVSEAA